MSFQWRKIVSSINGVERTGLVHAKNNKQTKKQQQKNETRPPTYTMHQNKLKMDKRLEY